MCALFGFSSYKRIVPHKLLKKLTQELANAAEERGTDAAGISYILNKRVVIYKRPKPAHKIHFNIPHNITAVMGHTRLTTQGSENYNYNNHPFKGCADKKFALAHNGVLYNDRTLRKTLKLPATKIETDSYVAVQLIEKYGELSVDSLKYMAETVSGMFTFSVLDENNSLYIVKGSNPMCIAHFSELGLYVYASTGSILNTALKKTGLSLERYSEIKLHDGDIIKIDRNGEVTLCEFVSQNYIRPVYDSWHHIYHFGSMNEDDECCDEENSVSQLLEVCSIFGVNTDDVMTLLESGYYSVEDIEDMLSDSNMIRDAVESCCMI